MGKIAALDIKHLAKLSSLTLDQKEEGFFKKQFEETLKIIEKFDKLDTSQNEETYQVTGLTNILREDKVDPSRMLSQDEALSNAKNIHNGYFVVDAVLHEQ